MGDSNNKWPSSKISLLYSLRLCGSRSGASDRSRPTTLKLEATETEIASERFSSVSAREKTCMIDSSSRLKLTGCSNHLTEESFRVDEAILIARRSHLNTNIRHRLSSNNYIMVAAISSTWLSANIMADMGLKVDRHLQ